MKRVQLKKIVLEIKDLAEEVRGNLGSGFNEGVFQNALAIEFRRSRIEYLKEVNIEIFYKGESVGVDRPDFVITKIGKNKSPIILETKVTDKITDDNRAQLKSYCISLPRNNNPVLNGFSGGLLLSFPKCDVESSPSIKTFVVDSKFNIILDDQKEEDCIKQLEKEKERQKKKQKKAKKKK